MSADRTTLRSLSSLSLPMPQFRFGSLSRRAQLTSFRRELGKAAAAYSGRHVTNGEAGVC